MRWKIERNSDGSFNVFCNEHYIDEYERAFNAVVNEIIDGPHACINYDEMEGAVLD